MSLKECGFFTPRQLLNEMRAVSHCILRCFNSQKTKKPEGGGTVWHTNRMHFYMKPAMLYF